MTRFDAAVFLRPIAHRGLHDPQQGRIENTAPAFLAAIEHDYGIECDIRPAADGLPVVFHDDSTRRLFGEDLPVSALTAPDLHRLRHGDRASSILRYDDFLELVAGRVPLLVEIKSDWQDPDATFLDEVIRLSRSYDGPIALMSFDPAIMKRVRAQAPEFPRGLVATGMRPDEPPTLKLGAQRALELSQLLEAGSVAPDFYAYNVCDLPAPGVRDVREVQHLPVFAWTVRTAEDYVAARRWADAPIFEGPIVRKLLGSPLDLVAAQ